MIDGADGKWHWRAVSDAGVWSHGAKWARPFSAAAPWVSLALLMATFALVSGEMVVARGTVFDMPPTGVKDVDVPGLTAFVLPVPREAGGGDETMVFFDDDRFVPADPRSEAHLASRLSSFVSSAKNVNLLLLADRRVPSGDLMNIMAIARKAGVRHVQVAERRD